MDVIKFRFKWIVFLAIAGSYTTCFHTIDAASSKAYSKVCQTEACRNIATSILQKMDQEVSPCDNFYEFVCGNFSRNAEISPTRSQIDTISLMRDMLQNQLRNSIENEISDKDPEAFQKLLTYYKTCMNEDQIEKMSNNEFMGILNNLGGWPVLLGESYPEDTFNWIDAVTKINKLGYSGDYFFSVNTGNDLKNNTRNLFYLDQPIFGISQEYLSKGLENNIVKAYFKYMIDVAEIFGADREVAKQELGKSMNFEIELAKISLSRAQRRDVEKLYNPMKISEVESKYPYMQNLMLRYLNEMLSPFYRLTEDEVVVVEALSFYEKLGDLIARTPARVMANYVNWRVTYASSTLLNQKVRDAYREFTASLTGNNNKKPRWQDCVTSSSGNMFIATSALYARRNFGRASKDGVTNMIKHLRQSFKTILLEVDWMDEATRGAALRKLEQIIPLVGYFDESLDDDKINDYYKDLKLYPESYLQTVLSYKRFAIARQMKSYGDTNPRVDWTDRYYASDVVNAFYSPSVNTIQFPAGILQGDFYNEEIPNYINYGGIGSVIGHELTHAFDDQGCRFDGTGNMVDWWEADTKKEYLRRAKCIVDQYSGYVDPQAGLNLNGELTQGENIADNGGLKEAYLAYKSFEEENGEEPTLPGFEGFTPRQLLWISYSNCWCAKYRTEHLKNIITTDPHSPNQFRVIGAVTNSPYFARDFNCPLGSPMNPEKKCSVW